jgi:UDP-N-acetylmuramyl pentapeptide synthase
VALVNNAQREHQEFMHSVQAVAEENGAVIQALSDHGVAVLPVTDEHHRLWRDYAGSRRVVDFGNSTAAVHVKHALWLNTHWQLNLQTPQGLLTTQLHLPGQHNLHNAMAAVAAALAVGVPMSAIEQGLTQFQPVNGRSKVSVLQHVGRSITLIDDSYNANPDSVRAATDMLAQSAAPRLLVLGDMGEVGTQGAAFHAEAGEYAQQQHIEHVLTLGELSLHTASVCANAVHCHSMDELLQRLNTLLPNLSSVLVKGSRFMRMERVVQALQNPEQQAASLPRKEASCC